MRCEVCGQEHAPTCIESIGDSLIVAWEAFFAENGYEPAPHGGMRLRGRSFPDLVNESTLEAMWALPARDPEGS